jgi:F-type H+-transporting ATPase subunit gamma
VSDNIESLRHKISGGSDLASVVRTMKALAASNISQYERAVVSLEDYFRAVELGLIGCVRQGGSLTTRIGGPKLGRTTAAIIVLGSDQGLVGQFNLSLANFVRQTLHTKQEDMMFWAVGERVQLHLQDDGFKLQKVYAVPNSVQAITPLVTQILLELGSPLHQGWPDRIYLFYNRPMSGALYEPTIRSILPLEEMWQDRLAMQPWPAGQLPEVLNGLSETLKQLIQEYIFVSLFRASAESLASENASRLAAMQRAEKNIKDLLENLLLSYHHLRQRSIDEELFDVIAGSEALRTKSS